MHGLINRAIQSFLRDTYGADFWAELTDETGLDPDGFEAMMTYPETLTDAVLGAASARLSKPRDALLEDLGTYLVSLEPLRRLLRFGGVTYLDFLETIEELPERAQLAVSDIGLPTLRLRAHAQGQFTLLCQSNYAGFGHVFVGVLRALADDYGVLALIDHGGAGGQGELLDIALLDISHAEGRRFDLASPMIEV